ncbi:MAG: hypothetical protein ACXAEN_20845 [Candidatus Thorarchaeota archaeon]|jgi:hypothetical protein
MIDRYNTIRDKYIGLKDQLDNAKSQLRRTAVSLTLSKSNRSEWLMAREFFIGIAKLTQSDITDYLESTVSLAMDVIPSDEEQSLLAEFETRRNQQELDLYFQEGDQEPIPLDSKIDLVGNSVEEVISFASKLCTWSIMNPRPAPFQAHDEPFRALKDENIGNVLKFVKEIQEELGLQMLILTHRPDIANIGDRVFYLDKKKGRTTVSTRSRGDDRDTVSSRGELSSPDGGRGRRRRIVLVMREEEEEPLQRRTKARLQGEDHSI